MIGIGKSEIASCSKIAVRISAGSARRVVFVGFIFLSGRFLGFNIDVSHVPKTFGQRSMIPFFVISASDESKISRNSSQLSSIVALRNRDKFQKRARICETVIIERKVSRNSEFSIAYED